MTTEQKIVAALIGHGLILDTRKGEAESIVRTAMKSAGKSDTPPQKVGPLDHTSKMPFGKHSGLTMEEVPADYLVWLGDSLRKSRKDEALRPEAEAVFQYIDDNWELIEDEAQGQGARMRP